MASVLVSYSTGEGQTARIAGRIADELRERGHDAATVDLAEGDPPPIDDYDTVIVGASIHVGKHQPEVLAFVRDALAALLAGRSFLPPRSL